ncbi:hypothetical protein TWF696_003047 [Orbilia brochopaga]|uniref:Histone H4 n=1 Tax=Orbilia brochopaga TaxID=3140254 RepID=A0AAV9TYN4_9PEZI
MSFRNTLMSHSGGLPVVIPPNTPKPNLSKKTAKRVRPTLVPNYMRTTPASTNPRRRDLESDDGTEEKVRITNGAPPQRQSAPKQTAPATPAARATSAAPPPPPPTAATRAERQWESTPAEPARTAPAARESVAPVQPPAARAETPTAGAAARRSAPNGGHHVRVGGKSVKRMEDLRRYRHTTHRRILIDNIKGVTQPAIRRMARRGGVKRISAGIYDAVRVILKARLEKLVRDCVMYCEHARRRTVTVSDVIFALKVNGTPIYGFDPATFNAKKKDRVLKARK